MRGSRQCFSKIFALIVTGFLTLNGTAFSGTANLISGASSLGGAESAETSVSEEIIRERIRELKELSTSMDAIHINMIKVAEKALKDSDSAPTLTERRRYEQLYAETSVRLGEFRTTRAEIDHLLGKLQAQLEALKNAQ